MAGSQGGLLPPENKLKSKSLPRGLPSDGTVYNDSVESQDKTEDNNNVSEKESEDKVKRHQQKEALVMEELRLKFEYEELLTMKSELERKKRTERREIAELQEEIATMQTLYQYRSVHFSTVHFSTVLYSLQYFLVVSTESFSTLP